MMMCRISLADFVHHSDRSSFDHGGDSLDEDMKRVSNKMTALAAITSKTTDIAENRIHGFNNTLEVIRETLPNIIDNLQRIQEQQLLEHNSSDAPNSTTKGKKGNKKLVSTDRIAQEKGDAAEKFLEHLIGSEFKQ